jgi:steroid Delta-isomerase
MTQNGESDCTRIYEQWHEFTKARQAEKLIDLYADDAVLESPLVMLILDDKTEGVLRGRREIRHFFDEGLRRRPDDLLRWYRTGIFLTNGKVVTWEYPRQTPDGNQMTLSRSWRSKTARSRIIVSTGAGLASSRSSAALLAKPRRNRLRRPWPQAKHRPGVTQASLATHSG